MAEEKSPISAGGSVSTNSIKPILTRSSATNSIKPILTRSASLISSNRNSLILNGSTSAVSRGTTCTVSTGSSELLEPQVLLDQLLEVQSKIDQIAVRQVENSKLINTQSERCQRLNKGVTEMTSQLNEMLLVAQKMKKKPSSPTKAFKRRSDSILSLRRKPKQT